MASYIEQYIEDAQARTNRSRDALMSKLTSQVLGLMDELQLSNQPEPGHAFATFLAEWARLWVKVWTGSVCAPPRSKVEAATLWELSEPQVLAGFELAALFRAAAFDRAMADTFQRQAAKHPRQKAILRELQEHQEIKNPSRVAKFVEDGAGWLRQETRNNVENIIALLPEDRIWAANPEPDSPLLSSLRNEAPATVAMAWRFVVEMQRCRGWMDTSIEDELRRLSSDRTAQLLASWDGLIWVAVALWQECRELIEAQAKAEGKIDRREAQRNSKAALHLVNDILIGEMEYVRRVRAA
jgi:hypothetical protein